MSNYVTANLVVLAFNLTIVFQRHESLHPGPGVPKALMD